MLSRLGGDRLALFGAAALVLLAPLELRQPWFSAVGQHLTNLEGVVLIVTTAWLAAEVSSGRLPRWRTSLTLPGVALLTALAVSALNAVEDVPGALKHVGRLLAAAMVALLAMNAATTPRRLRLLMALAIPTGALVAGLAILEYLEVGPALDMLTAFRPGFHVVGGRLRAASTLSYPTIASMYLEIVFAFGLGLLLVAVDQRRAVASVCTAVALVVVAAGVVVTFSRAGLAMLGVSLMIMAAARYRQRGFDVGLRVLVLLVGAIAAITIATWSTDWLRLRFASEHTDGWYRADYVVPDRIVLRTGNETEVEVTVSNAGRVTWTSDVDPKFKLSYHWLEADGVRVVRYYGVRTDFPVPVAPGESVRLRARVRAPSRPGEFRLVWDIINENRFWFSTERSPSGVTQVTVVGATTGIDRPDIAALPTVRANLGRLELWRIAGRMLRERPWLGVGPDNFRLTYGRYAGLVPFDTRVHTSNMYVEFIVSGGICGGLALAWLLLRALTTLRTVASRSHGAEASPNTAIAAAGVVILLHGLVDTFVAFTPIYIMVALVLGFVVAAEAHVDGRSGRV